MAAHEDANASFVYYAPLDPTLPEPWKGLIDNSTGTIYYWNTITNATLYEKPPNGALGHRMYSTLAQQIPPQQQFNMPQPLMQGYHDPRMHQGYYYPPQPLMHQSQGYQPNMHQQQGPPNPYRHHFIQQPMHHTGYQQNMPQQRPPNVMPQHYPHQKDPMAEFSQRDGAPHAQNAPSTVNFVETQAIRQTGQAAQYSDQPKVAAIPMARTQPDMRSGGHPPQNVSPSIPGGSTSHNKYGQPGGQPFHNAANKSNAQKRGRIGASLSMSGFNSGFVGGHSGGRGCMRDGSFGGRGVDSREGGFGGPGGGDIRDCGVGGVRDGGVGGVRDGGPRGGDLSDECDTNKHVKRKAGQKRRSRFYDIDRPADDYDSEFSDHEVYPADTDMDVDGPADDCESSEHEVYKASADEYESSEHDVVYKASADEYESSEHEVYKASADEYESSEHDVVYKASADEYESSEHEVYKASADEYESSEHDVVYKAADDLDAFADDDEDGDHEVFEAADDLDALALHCEDGDHEVFEAADDLDGIHETEMKCDSEGSNEMAGGLISWGQCRKARCSGPFVAGSVKFKDCM